MRGLILFFALSFLACQPTNQPDSKLPAGIAHTYYQLGEGQKPQTGETISAYLRVLDARGDTLHYVPDYLYFWPLGQGDLDSAFKSMRPGDSLSFSLSRKKLYDYFRFYQLIGDDTAASSLHVRLIDIYDRDQGALAHHKSLAKRELVEQEKLQKLLAKNSDSLEMVGEVYRKIYGRTNGIPLSYGDEVTIQYKGSFLNGYVFDNSFEKDHKPSFTYGEEHQLIDGIHYGLIGMKEGERVKIIVPSRRAFGEDGSIAGIVPPYTSVIFDIQLIKVKKK